MDARKRRELEINARTADDERTEAERQLLVLVREYGAAVLTRPLTGQLADRVMRAERIRVASNRALLDR